MAKGHKAKVVRSKAMLDYYLSQVEPHPSSGEGRPKRGVFARLGRRHRINQQRARFIVLRELRRRAKEEADGR